MIDYKAWNEQFGGEKAVKAVEEAKENKFTETPEGVYKCKLEKLELGESRTHKPIVKGMFRIKEGAYKKSCLFYNGVMAANDPGKSGFCIHNVLEFLRSLNVFEDDEIDFDGDYEHFNDLLLDIAEEAQGMTFEILNTKDGQYTRIECVDSYEA